MMLRIALRILVRMLHTVHVHPMVEGDLTT
jgi:hypothetical protein